MYTNNLIHMVSLQRCGTHAIANWILHQCAGITTQQPLIECYNDTHYFTCNGAAFCLFNNRFFHDDKLARNTPYGPIEYNLHTAIIIYEIANINEFNTNFEDKDQIFGTIKKEKTIFVLRDVLNCFASWYQKEGHIPKHIRKHWHTRALEWIGITQYVPHKIKINYNKWWDSQTNRRTIVDKLELDFTDIGIDHVPRFGDGSSFDGTTKDGQAQTMSLHTRYKQVGPRFWSFLTDPKFIELSEAIFGVYHD